MTTRRRFLRGLLALPLVPVAAKAAEGTPEDEAVEFAGADTPIGIAMNDTTSGVVTVMTSGTFADANGSLFYIESGVPRPCAGYSRPVLTIIDDAE